MQTDAFDHRLFDSQVAVVTGAAEGIGYEIARALAAHGATVALNDIDPTRLENAVAALEGEGHECVGFVGDVGETGFCERLVSDVVDRFGSLDIAVANAGITLWSSFLDLERESFDRVAQVNLGGSFFLAQAAARHMKDRADGGRLLFVSSVAGRRSIRNLSAYSMTKGGLEALTRALVVELSPFNITVNCLVPGSTLTPRNLDDDPSYEEVWADVTPTGRAATGKDQAHAALALLAPHAGQITGQTVTVDGGWTVVSRPPRGPEGPRK